MPGIGDDSEARHDSDKLIRLSGRRWSAQRHRRRTHPLRIVVIETGSMAVVPKSMTGPAMC
ncbi:MAG: hypothetical protein WA609_13980, partial [Terriglobales bacterium]